jgi:hypothetical protein
VYYRNPPALTTTESAKRANGRTTGLSANRQQPPGRVALPRRPISGARQQILQTGSSFSLWEPIRVRFFVAFV